MRAYLASPYYPDSSASSAGSPLAARLNEALGSKLAGMLRGRRHHFMARRHGTTHAVDLFLAHSNAEQAHADSLAARIVELHGEPRFSPPAAMDLGTALYGARHELAEMARDALEATRELSLSLKELLRFVGADDAATRRVLVAILGADRVRAKELAALVLSLAPRPRA